MIAPLNTVTATFDENRTGGLLICGINWGGNPAEASVVEERSFFSDRSVNDYPYRNRLVRWFAMWGHPLEQIRGREGSFERSIVQTNWLPDQDRSMRARNMLQECIAERENFFFHIDALLPRVLLLCGSTLMQALNAPECLGEAEKILGSSRAPDFRCKEVMENGKRLKRFKVGIQHFERCPVIAVPHPTGSIGVSNAYMAAFQEEIDPILHSYRQRLWPNNALQATREGARA